MRPARVLLLVSLFFLFLFPMLSGPAGDVGVGGLARGIAPRPAANIGANNTFPGVNQQLYASSQYNFTTGLRDEANFNRVYDSANLVIQQSDQVAYRNSSVENLGFFNGSYSFTNHRSGGLAESFAWNGVGATSVVAERLGHRQVLKLDGTGAAYCTQILNFAAITSNEVNISYWLGTGASFRAGTDCEFLAFQGVTTGPYLSLQATGVLSYYVASWNTILQLVVNRWYHVRISVRLDTDRYDVYVDGAKLANNVLFAGSSNLAQVDTLKFGSYDPEFYVDAVDVEQAGVLNRNAIDLGEIGVYNATHSFEGDAMFGVPGGFTDWSGASTYAKVFPSVATGAYNHHNLLCLDDWSGTYAAQVNLSTSMTQGSLEFWFFSTAVNEANQANITGAYKADTSLYATYLYISSSNLYTYSASAPQLVQAVVANTWYHVRMQFDCTTYKYSTWINGMLKQSQLAFQTNVQIIGTFMFATNRVTTTKFQLYLDAIDLSTDPAYYPERSSYLRLNSTQSFSVPGSYSSKWVAWSAGVNYDAPLVPFTVRENVQLNSESNVMTRWTFTDMSSGSWTSLYSSDFGTDNYVLLGTSNYEFDTGYQTIITHDSWTSSINPANNYGSYTTLYAGDAPNYIYLGYQSPYLSTNASLVSLREYSWTNTPLYDVSTYETTVFDESTITWNTQPALGAFVSTVTQSNYDYTYFDLTGHNTGWIGQTATKAFPRDAYKIYSKENANLKPEIRMVLSKFNHATGLCYLQTNTTEQLTLRSHTLSTLNLQVNDRISITFNTTSQRQINLNLKESGSTVWDQPLVTNPNYNFNTQSKTFTITDEITIDQVEFTGTFDDTKNLQITSIVIERPTFPSYTFDVGPLERREVALAPIAYELVVIDAGSGETVLEQSVAILKYTLNKFSYSPLAGGQRLVNFFNPAGDLLDFYQFRCNLTRTYNNLTVNYNLATPYFYGDDGSTFWLNVTDRFGNSIINYSDYVSTFIDITLTNVYSLKIKNEMRLPALLQLTRNAITQAEYAMAGEIVAYALWNGTYQLNYTQSELGVPVSIDLAVTAASIYNISSAYRTIYFSAFSNDGLGLPADTVRLYLNGTRKSWGPVEVLGVANITVLDYVNDTQYSAIVDLSSTSELNVFVNVATVILNNQLRNESISISISKGGILLQETSIGPGNSLAFRFTNGNYEIRCTYANGTVESRSQTVLATGSDLATYRIDLGWYDEVVPIAADPAGWWIFAISLVVYATIFIALYVRAAKKRDLKEKRQEHLTRARTTSIWSEGASE